MLANPLPPVATESNRETGQMLEAFALSYLAKYNTDAILTRVRTAYQRAWGIGDITMFPRVNGGRPGFLLASYDMGTWTKLVVAIEGTTTMNQLVNLFPGSNAVVPTGLLGRVCNLWNSYADDILTALAANVAWSVPVNVPTTCVTFTGFSLGAACAEVAAFKHLLTHQSQTVQVRKFASPRVGNQVWYANRNRRCRVSSIHMLSDPVQLVPAQITRGIAETSLFPDQWSRVYACDEDPNQQCFDHRGRETRARITEAFVSPSDVYRSALRTPLVPSHPWWFHQSNYYRVVFMGMAAAQNDLLRARFNYLEHNDENSWQSLYRGAGPDYIPASTILDPAPDPYSYATAAEATLARVAPTPPVIASQPLEDWEIDFLNGWGTEAPTQTLTRRQRHQ